MKTLRDFSPELTLVLGAFLLATSATAQIAVGTIGHSLTDEYQRPQSNRQAGLDGFNWVEILSRTRASEVSFGPYDATLDANDEPGGYAYNHAIGGAQVLNSNMPQQVAAVAADLSAGRIDAVVIWIGSLDFSVRMWAGASFDLNDPSFQSFQASFVAALVDAVDTLVAAGASDIALAQIGPADPTRNDIVLATNDTNDKLAAALATRPQVIFFDPLSEIAARYDVPSNSVRIGNFSALASAAPSSDLVAPPGGVTPTQCGFNDTTKAPGCPTAAYQGYVIQDDGAHLTTPMQGLVANAVAQALRARGFALTALSDADILAISGVAPAPPPPPPSLALSWRRLASKCKRATSTCRIKGQLIARNGASVASLPVALSFTLSDDATPDPGDLALASRTVPVLKAGRLTKVKLNATLPAGVVPTGHYLIALPSGGAPFVQGPLN